MTDALDDQDADAYFAERGFRLRVREVNLDDQLARQAPSRGSTHWADLLSLDSDVVVSEAYGSGMSDEDARLRAMYRWQVEQEPPLPLPRRLP